MTKPLVECIPNFSEARRPEVIEEIVSVIKNVTEISLLNHSSDLDHNRTVVTFAGPPMAVEEAAFRAIQKAAELIDLEKHTGSHPRVGASDVVPFVPLSGIEMIECVQMAHRLGERVGLELGIPVYLYENAATRPDRVNLENIRQGQYEGLKAEIGTNPDRRPDFGPAELGPAGASIIGARSPLIAFNVFLSSADVSIAKAIAKVVRYSSGGFRYVKGLGMLVDGMAQVSMNLTDFRHTPIHRVVETIRREASRHGVNIHHSELVGLIPGEALMDAAAWYLQLDDFQPDQVLETRLYSIQSGEGAGMGFLDSLAAGSAVPGGGSAAAYAGAMGAALVAMVARLTIGKKKYKNTEAQMVEIINQAEQLRKDLTKAVEEDSAAYQAILAAFRLAREDEQQKNIRDAAIEHATLNASRVPLMTAEKAVKVMELAERCAILGNLNAISDASSAAMLAKASLKCAGYNVRININNLCEKTTGAPFLEQLTELERKANKIDEDIHRALQERGGLTSP